MNATAAMERGRSLVMIQSRTVEKVRRVQQHAAPINQSELLDVHSVFSLGTHHQGTTMARTTLRSRSGRKLYAKRSKTGQFEDIQSYRRAQGQDIKRSSAAER